MAPTWPSAAASSHYGTGVAPAWQHLGTSTPPAAHSDGTDLSQAFRQPSARQAPSFAQVGVQRRLTRPGLPLPIVRPQLRPRADVRVVSLLIADATIAMSAVDEWCPSSSDSETLRAEEMIASEKVLQEHVVEVGKMPEEAIVVDDDEGDSLGAGRAASSTQPAPSSCTRRKAKAPRLATTATTRKLRRRVSDAKPSSVTVLSLLCVWGKPLKAPVPVYPIRRDPSGKAWIHLSEHLLWLRRAVAPTGSTHYQELFQSALSDLRRTLREQIEDGRKSTSSGAEQAKLRAALQLSDDDEGPCASRGVASKARKGQPTGVVSVKIKDTVVQVKNSTRPLILECTQDSVTSVVAFCQEHCRAGTTTLRKHRRAESGKPSFQMPLQECPAILGKVTWHPSAGAWAVHYKDEHGKTITTRISVPARNAPKSLCQPEGTRRDREAYAQARRAKYVEACAFWNEHDRSQRERIAVDTPSQLQS